MLSHYLPYSRIVLGRGNIKLNKIHMVFIFANLHTMQEVENLKNNCNILCIIALEVP